MFASLIGFIKRYFFFIAPVILLVVLYMTLTDLGYFDLRSINHVQSQLFSKFSISREFTKWGNFLNNIDWDGLTESMSTYVPIFKVTLTLLNFLMKIISRTVGIILIGNATIHDILEKLVSMLYIVFSVTSSGNNGGIWVKVWNMWG